MIKKNRKFKKNSKYQDYKIEEIEKSNIFGANS